MVFLVCTGVFLFFFFVCFSRSGCILHHPVTLLTADKRSCFSRRVFSSYLSWVLQFIAIVLFPSACSKISIEIQICFIQMDNDANKMDVCWEVWCGKTSPFACDMQTQGTFTKGHSVPKMIDVYFRSAWPRM